MVREDCRRVVRLVGVPIVSMLLALSGPAAFAQVRSGVPAAQQEFLGLHRLQDQTALE